MTLRDVKTGQTVTVQKITGEGAIKKRIMDMGITKVQKSLSEKLHRSVIR